MDKYVFLVIFLVLPFCIHSYRSRIKREASQCYQCSSVTSNDECTTIQQCPGGDYGGCQTEVRTDGGGVMRITKKCKDLGICMSEEQQFSSQCTGHHVPQSICYYCCQEDLCNEYLPEESPTTTATSSTTTTTTTALPTTTPTTTTTKRPTRPNPCDPNQCLNGGTCLPDGDGFGCYCPDDYLGERCEIPPGKECADGFVWDEEAGKCNYPDEVYRQLERVLESLRDINRD